MTGAGPAGPARRLAVRVDADAFAVEVADAGDGRLRVRVDGRAYEVDARGVAGGPASLLVDGASYLVDVEEHGDDLVVAIDGDRYRVRVDDPARARAGPASPAAPSGQRLVAPMPGKVVAVHVEVGQVVEAGAPLLVLEAMKMENEFRAAAGGTVAEVRVAPGQPVNAGDLLVVLAGDPT